MKHLLRAIVGPQAGEVIVLGHRATVGRAADCEIQILHEGVSRHHAKLSVADGFVRLTDLSSGSGTFVNGARVQRCVLDPGDTLRVLDSHFLYECVEDTHPATTSQAYETKVTSGDSLRRTCPIPRIASVAGVPNPSAPPPPPQPSAATQPSNVEAPDTAARATSPGAEAVSPGAGGEAQQASAQTAAGSGPASSIATLSPAAYAAGTSGRWRRSAGSAAHVRSRSGPGGIGVRAAAEIVRRPLAASTEDDLDDTPTPHMGSARLGGSRTADVAAPPSAPRTSEPPPVTTGSGAFPYPVDPARVPGSTGRWAYLGEQGQPQSNQAAQPGRARFPTGEVRRTADDKGEGRVPSAARGGSAVAVVDQAGVSPRSATMADDVVRTQGVGSRRRAPPPTPEATPAIAQVAPPVRRGTDEWAAALPSIEPSTESPTRAPVERPDTGGVIADRRPISETGEYPSRAVVPQTGEYGSVADGAPWGELAGSASGPAGPGEVAAQYERAMEALTVELARRAAGGSDLDAEANGHDGVFALAAVLRYRDFRLRTLTGGQLSSTEKRHFDQLDRYLLRSAPDSDELVAMRRFTRFTCGLPAELSRAQTRGATLLPVAVNDIGAGGAQLDVGRAALGVGDVAWLALDLAGVSGLPVPGASNVIFELRVVWAAQARLGVVFAGAARYGKASSAL